MVFRGKKGMRTLQIEIRNVGLINRSGYNYRPLHLPHFAETTIICLAVRGCHLVDPAHDWSLRDLEIITLGDIDAPFFGFAGDHCSGYVAAGR